MNITLFMRKAEQKKEATHITINAFAEQLKHNHTVNIISGRKTTDYLSQLRKTKQIDIIHSFAAAPLLALNLIIAKLMRPKAKTVFTLKSYSRHPLGSLLFTPLLNVVSAVTVPTHIYANKLKKHGLKKNKIHIIRSSINIEKFTPKNKTELKEKYGFKNKKVVLYYGSLFPSKGVDYLINASESIAQQHEDAIILIAPRESANERLTQQTKHKQNIKIIPEINVVDYVNLADIVVLPYTDLTATEGNPSCMLEAVACKTAVITTQLPELEELFTSEEITKVPPKDSKALAEAINNLLTDDKRRKQLADNAHKKIYQFDIKKITKDFEDLYREIIKK